MKLVTLVEPKLTLVALARLVPVIVTAVSPAAGPVARRDQGNRRRRGRVLIGAQVGRAGTGPAALVGSDRDRRAGVVRRDSLGDGRGCRWP